MKKRNYSVESTAPLERRIMERIRVENIQMKSPFVFLLSKIATGFSICFLAVVGIFFVSMIFHRLTALQVFGIRFVSEHIPWFSVGISLTCLLVCFAIIEYYKVIYKLSLTTLMTLLVIIFVGLGFLTYKTNIHAQLQKSSFRGIYAAEGKPLQIFAGRIIELRTQNSFLLETIRGEKIKIYIPETTRVPEHGFSYSDSLFVGGYYQEGQVIGKAVLVVGSKK